MKLGKFEIYPIDDGFFALDGGAMFGVVPKVFWEKTNPSDDRNRISLALRSVLVKTEKEKALIDTGIGDKFNPKFKEIYRVDKTYNIDESLNSVGIKPADINIVINTHLHFDHCGGNTKIDESGQVVPRFPNAKYFIQKDEWEYALKPDTRSKASYIDDNYRPLEKYGNLKLINGDYLITQGIEVIKTAGHTIGHQIVKIKSDEKIAVYWGDLIPTATHLNVPYVMGYDLFPLTTMEWKEKLLQKAAEEKWLMMFEHDPKHSFGYLKQEQNKWVCEPVDNN
jgi:glyoxylase-like metal-dependent hydrolase (beta-lactamase superfamily II)